jgi:uncharacterized integral membrane protein
MRSLTEVKLPRRMAWRVMIEKKISTMFSHDPDVGVKCSVTSIYRKRSLRPQSSGHFGPGAAETPGRRQAGSFHPIGRMELAPEPGAIGASARWGDSLWRPGPMARAMVPPPRCPPSHPAGHLPGTGGKLTPTGGAWSAVAAFAVVLLLLLTFILENRREADIANFGTHAHMTLGMARLLAAVLGALLAANPADANHPAAKSGPQAVAGRGQEREPTANSHPRNATRTRRASSNHA